MPIIAILAIIFFAMTVGSLLIMEIANVFLPDFVTTQRAELALKIIGNVLAIIIYVSLAGLLVTGIVAMCVYFPY
ncbi:MAG: hypothetical protein NC131_00865 [Roseburia sp.]|nr:hypothetical protein [Roseburia sp.]